MDDPTVQRAFWNLTTSEAAARAANQRLHGQNADLRAQNSTNVAELSVVRAELARMKVDMDVLRTTNNQLQMSLDMSRNGVEALQRIGIENSDYFAPPPTGASGGGPGGIERIEDVDEDLDVRPRNYIHRAFVGDGSNRNTISRWKVYATSVLGRFKPDQLKITIAALYSDLLQDSACLASALSDAFASRPDIIDELLPPGFMSGRIKQAQEEFVCSMTKHWSKARCLDLKFRNWLSREKYSQVRKSLSSTFEDGIWVRKSHNGTLFPTLSSRFSLDKVSNEIANASGLEQFAEGLGAIVALRKLVQVLVSEQLCVRSHMCVSLIVYVCYVPC